jgi:hypothetical protein
VLFGKAGAAYAVWEETSGGETDLKVARNPGTGWGAPITLAWPGAQRNPGVMLHGNALWVVWQESGGVFMRKLDDQGQPLAEPYAVTVGGPSYQHPAIATDGSEGVVTWGTSGTAGLLNLFVQRFAP